MNENIFISIIIPNLNQGKFLSRCIDSILDQKFNSFEIIIIDSYSIDESDKIFDRPGFQDSLSIIERDLRD